MDYQSLGQDGKIMAEYIWLGGKLWDIRSKCRTLDFKVRPGTVDIDKLPVWNYDGSSTEQAPGHDSEVLLRPQRVYKDPFRKGDNILVLCDTVDTKGNPLPTNHRAKCAAIMKKFEAEEPWFGLEQEYTMLHSDVKWPLGFPKSGYAGPQGPYYCGVGTGNAIGRELVEAHYRCCLYSGIKISGINAEVMPSQWEFQVGPCLGMSMGDDLWMARYLMMRASEYYNIRVSFAPKPIEEGDWNGAGCHSNYSTKGTRGEGGMAVIEAMMKKLEAKHKVHIAAYGEDNEKRLTGKHETASIEKFSYGVANRGCSVRIPNDTAKAGKGYFEDRRPAANCCPYIVTGLIVETTCSD
jgi:glutamine synthetase